ncbi:Uridine nucleosidase 1 [Cytospora mali]|uniref:Uridine nucleosidase 1 n=1 Tax=Cytospora mali TaxID=578113 RepID=A0A194VYY7_CYTMA|nr:Uridine nucleosidase 1 [Valsa mali]
MPPIPVLIDTDPGIDDSVAILLALLSPNISIKAITRVSGNLTADICTRNALKVLDLSSNLGAREITVSQGPLAPICRPYPKDPFSHGADGLGELGLKDSDLKEDGRWAPDVILETVNSVWKETKDFKEDGDEGLTVLCLGPLTNLALAIKKDPTLPSRIRKVIAISGSFGFGTAGSVRATGDNPASEWNVFVDPEAADMVFKSGLGSKVIALGLDVTTRIDIDLSARHREKLAEVIAASAKTSSEASFILGVVGFGESKGFPSYCCLIDSLAVAVAIDESLVGAP